jgi:hypothetical protein
MLGGDYSRVSNAEFCMMSYFFCGVVDRCGEIIMHAVYVVSCVGVSLLPALGY